MFDGGQGKGQQESREWYKGRRARVREGQEAKEAETQPQLKVFLAAALSSNLDKLVFVLVHVHVRFVFVVITRVVVAGVVAF